MEIWFILVPTLCVGTTLHRQPAERIDNPSYKGLTDTLERRARKSSLLFPYIDAAYLIL
jgi:hypothetical protein